VTFIRRLELRGFKSSGPRTVTINFERGFTVITGPNGSGKSNIADAILFAIGENSPKQLRAANGRLSGLIYDPRKDDAPGAQKPKECRVTIQFDNSDRAIPVDSDLVTVTRELRADGDNVYYLNGRKSTRGALTEVLDLAGLSPGGLNIVPQGAASKVVDLTPDEKRKMIEEVVGIAKFDERKSEAQRQLGQADQRLEVAMARIGEMKSTLESLDSQRNDMIRFTQLEREINWLTAVSTSKRITGLRARLADLRAEEQGLNVRLSELGARVADAEAKIAGVEAERNRFIVEVIQGGGAGHVELQFQLAQVDNDLNSLEADLKVAQENVRVLEGDTIPQLKEVVGQKRKEVTARNSTVASLEAESKKQLARSEELTAGINDFQKAALTLRDTIERKGRQSARAQARLGDTTQRLNDLEIGINGVAASLNVERKRSEELKLRVDGYSAVLGKLEASTNSLYELHEGSSKELGAIDDQLSGVEKDHARLVASIEAASGILEKATAELSRDEAFRKMSESLSGERTGQRKLQELCAAGGIPGYVGRLGQLVRYQPQYSQAVAAVLGKWMGSFVVEDLRSMTQLIKAAKSMKARAFSVIPLSEVEDSRSTKVEASVGVIGPLAGALKTDERYVGVVNFLAGDAFLVESEAVGYILASEGVRAVTLAGEVFEPGGKAFSFGYQEVLMNLVEGLENLEGNTEVQDAVGALRNAITKRKAQLGEMESGSEALMKEKVKKIVSTTSLRAEATAYSKVARRYRSIFKNLERQYLKQRKAVERLDQELARLASKKEASMAEATALNRELNEINELGLDGMLSEIETERQRMAAEALGIRNKLSEVDMNLSRERGILDNVLLRTLEENETDLTNAQEDLKSNKEFTREAPRRIKEATVTKQELEARIEKLKESSRRSQPVLDEFDARVKRYREDREAATRAVAGAQKDLFAVTGQAESTRQRVEEALGSLRMLGFNEELETFEGSESLLEELNGEYQEVTASVNRGADRQYKDMYSNYKSLSTRHNELEKERNAIILFIENVEAEKRKVFSSAFETISRDFGAIFTRLTGGTARLELERPEEIFSGGLFLHATFGNKPEFESVSLSGGEKAVSGVSLILAMQSVQSHPFYMFDEIDAALDAVNSGNLATFLKERSVGAQIIGITLRDVFVSHSDVTYGAYSAGGVTRLVHYKPAEVPVSRG
jgi:chromosome segregation protein